MSEIVVKIPTHVARDLYGSGLAERLHAGGIDTKQPVTAAPDECEKCGSALIAFTGTWRPEHGGVEAVSR